MGKKFNYTILEQKTKKTGSVELDPINKTEPPISGGKKKHYLTNRELLLQMAKDMNAVMKHLDEHDKLFKKHGWTK